jgi:hypothetical protein
MESTDVDKTMKAGWQLKVSKAYVAPRIKRLTPVAVKDFLSRHADTSEFQQMIESSDHLHGAKGS